MRRNAQPADESPARAVALMVAANGRIDERELHVLDRLDAFRRLGVARERFVELARSCLSEIGPDWLPQIWLDPMHARYIDGLLDSVRTARERLMVCRFAAAVIVADGRVTSDERIVFARALGRWHITHTMVSHAIRNDPAH
jgi:hypothetical protein